MSNRKTEERFVELNDRDRKLLRLLLDSKDQEVLQETRHNFGLVPEYRTHEGKLQYKCRTCHTWITLETLASNVDPRTNRCPWYTEKWNAEENFRIKLNRSRRQF